MQLDLEKRNAVEVGGIPPRRARRVHPMNNAYLGAVRYRRTAPIMAINLRKYSALWGGLLMVGVDRAMKGLMRALEWVKLKQT